MGKRIIISISSDIGLALGRHWASVGHDVAGTFRRSSPALEELKNRGIVGIECDLMKKVSTIDAANQLAKQFSNWEVLVLAPGLQDPVGPFVECDFDEWEASVAVNFLAQLRLVHSLLPFRTKSTKNGPLVLFFAGGGTNNATVNYSAYTISKVALIKMCELFDAEIPDTRFSILGPGWVKTKIHDSTINAQTRAGENYSRTLTKLAGDDCVPIEKVVECCDWIASSSREIVGGRNFSLVYDKWGNKDLEILLKQDPNMYKLRRSGNERLVSRTNAETNNVQSLKVTNR